MVAKKLMPRGYALPFGHEQHYSRTFHFPLSDSTEPNGGRILLSMDATNPQIRKLSYRELGPTDAAELRRIRRRAIVECPQALGTPPHVELGKSLGHHRYQLRMVYYRRTEFFLGAWDGTALAAMVGCGRREHEGRWVNLIYSMYVEPDYRRCGTGRTLLEEAIDQAEQQWKASGTLLSVESKNRAAIDLYESAGFERQYCRPNAFEIDGVSYAVDYMFRART